MANGINGKTTSGFEFFIDEKALDDWEVLEALVDIDSGHFGAAVRVLKLLLGEKQVKELKEHCRDKQTGRVPRDAMFSELSEILKVKSTKNKDTESEKLKNA